MCTLGDLESKMAPVYLSACRLSCLSQSVVPVAPARLTSVLFLLCMVAHWCRVDSVLTYDRQALLNIKNCMGAHPFLSCSVFSFSILVQPSRGGVRSPVTLLNSSSKEAPQEER